MPKQKIIPLLWFNGNAEEAPAKSTQVMKAMFKMKQIDIAALERACAGE